jgi:hypothetical protein
VDAGVRRSGMAIAEPFLRANRTGLYG